MADGAALSPHRYDKSEKNCLQKQVTEPRPGFYFYGHALASNTCSKMLRCSCRFIPRSELKQRCVRETKDAPRIKFLRHPHHPSYADEHMDSSPAATAHISPE